MQNSGSETVLVITALNPFEDSSVGILMIFNESDKRLTSLNSFQNMKSDSNHFRMELSLHAD